MQPLLIISVIFITFLSYASVSGLSFKSVFGRVSSIFKKNVSGYYIAKNPVLNKGKSFTVAEQDKLGIRGLYPAGEPLSLELKVDVAMEQLRKKTSPLEKYIHIHYLTNLI